MHLSDIKQIEKFQTADNHGHKLLLLTDESQFSLKLTRFAEELTKLAPRIKIKKETTGIGEYPGIRMGSALDCHFIPTGSKLNGLLDTLAFWGRLKDSPEIEASDLFSNLELPAEIRLYVAEGCPHCPHVFSQLIKLPLLNSQIHLAVFDPTIFSKVAQKDNIRAVPTIILDRNFRWTGPLDLNELAQVINTRDPQILSAGSLEMLLKDGNAQTLVEMFQKSGKIYPAFIELLTHPLWSTRLGAMVVMETLIESEPDLAAQIQSSIWKKFDSVENSVKGDLLYIIGELCLKDNVMRLMAVVDGDYSSEVKEAASEALAKMSEV
ncbi:MAG: thioredoxin family protein [Desulfobacteraceae bacterium]|jgi:hypothetical protein